MITRRQMMKALAFGPAVLSPEFIAQIGFAQTAPEKETAARSAPAVLNGVTVRQVMLQPLPGMDHKMAAVLTVEYAPGAASQPHRHPGPVFGYVLEGSVVIQVDPGDPMTYAEGQMWYEPPTHTHRVSRNASTKAPARLLAFVIIDKGQTITIPVRTRA